MAKTAKSIIKRSNTDSFFIRAYVTSNRADNLLSANPTYNNNPVHVLQIMVLDDGLAIFEVM